MFSIRKMSVLVDETHQEAGRSDGDPLKKVAVMVAVKNPFVTGSVADIGPMVAFGGELGTMMSERLLREFEKNPALVESYGKGAIVGAAGELEHGYALITRPFAKPIREALGAKAWMSATVKRGPIGARLDVPLAFKNALFVRSHYDTIESSMPDAPLPDEVVVVLVGANRGRLHARIGGLRREDVLGADSYVDRD